MTIPKGFVELQTQYGNRTPLVIAADSVSVLQEWGFTDYTKPKMKTDEGQEYYPDSYGTRITTKTGLDLYTTTPITVVSALVAEAVK